MNTTNTAVDVAWLFMKEVVRLHALPKSIVSDRDTRFVSKFWAELHWLMQTQLLMSTAYHPQTDGLTERAIRHVEQVLQSLVDSDQLNWAECCPMAEFAINSSISSTTQFAPFELNYGWLPSIITEVPPTEFVGVSQFIEKALQNLDEAHDAIIFSRVNQTHQANKLRREEPDICPGELVYLATTDLNLPKGRAYKLTPRFIGPYKVQNADTSKSTYELELPPELMKRRIHPRFHVSRLRKHIPNDNSRFPKREVRTYYDFGDDPEVEWIVDKVVDHEWRGDTLYLRVTWRAGDQTWEPLSSCDKLSALDDYVALLGVREPLELPKK